MEGDLFYWVFKMARDLAFEIEENPNRFYRLRAELARDTGRSPREVRNYCTEMLDQYKVRCEEEGEFRDRCWTVAVILPLKGLFKEK